MELLQKTDYFILDMDGTVYLGEELIPGAREFITKLERLDKDFILLTNNSSRSKNYYLHKLASLGIEVSRDKIVTSGEATAAYICRQKHNPRVYLVGTSSLRKEFRSYGIEVITEQNESIENIDFVVVGFDTSLNYDKISQAHCLLLKGTEYLATNPDRVCPLERGQT
ncbi:MAG: HAD-IIA family hydrolase, partial [Halanaerobiales bacterium]